MNPQPVTLAVTLHPDGNLQLQGPVDNKILCLGLLDLARHAVLTHDPAKQPGILLGQRNGLPPRA